MCVSACLSEYYMSTGAHQGQTRALDSLELELHAGHYEMPKVGAGNQT